jgi:hypothetical protein
VTTAVPRMGADVLNDLDRRLAPADADLAARYPGDEGTRQPVHSVHVPADQLTPDVLAKLEREPVETWPPSPGGLATTPPPSCGWPPTSTGASPACAWRG